MGAQWNDPWAMAYLYVSGFGSCRSMHAECRETIVERTEPGAAQAIWRYVR
jgi:hypothetical protein